MSEEQNHNESPEQVDAQEHDHAHEEGSYLTPAGGTWATMKQWAFTKDHKKLGVMYMFAVLILFFLGGVAAIGVRMELWEPVRMHTETVVTDEGVTEEVKTVTGQRFNVGRPAERVKTDADDNPILDENGDDVMESYRVFNLATATRPTTAYSRSTGRSWSSWSSSPASPRRWATSSCPL